MTQANDHTKGMTIVQLLATIHLYDQPKSEMSLSGVVLRIFTSISILYLSALELPSSSVLICSSFFCIIALGSGQRHDRLGSVLGLVLVLVLPYSVEVNILNLHCRYYQHIFDQGPKSPKWTHIANDVINRGPTPSTIQRCMLLTRYDGVSRIFRLVRRPTA